MKYFFIPFLFITSKSFAQFDYKKELPSILTTFIAGANEGTSETLKWHYVNFKNTFPNSNPNYWDIRISANNKYKGGLAVNGPKFPGSTSMFVWTTDGYHMVRFVRNVSLVTTLMIHPSYKKRKWYYYFIDAGIHTLSYQIGFHTTYSLIFNNLR